ncbi:MAG: hypothetical protein K5829_02780 [Treponema sp.]|nr:hypothetical protein [Treponema sp.]
MKSVKKIKWGMLAFIAAFSLVFTACPKTTGSETEETSDPVSKDDSIESVSDGDEITVNSGESIQIKADGKSAYETEDDLPEGLTITEEDGIFTITASEDCEDSTNSICLYDGSDEDEGINITLYVYNPYYTLNITLADSVAQEAASIEVYAEGKEDSESSAALYQTVTASYTAGETSATAKLEKEKANSYKYFNNITVTVKDSAGEEIDTEASPVYFCYTDESFTGITISAATASKTFTIEFDGFTIAGGSVEGIKYSTKWANSSSEWSDDYVVTPTVTVSADGSSATFEVSSDNEFYIDWTLVSVKDSSSNEISISSGNTDSNKWYSYSGSVWSNTLTHVSGEYQNLCDAKEFTASSDYVQVLEASNFENLSISTLKVLVKLTSASEWWASASSAASWVDSTYQSLSWSDDDGGYSGVITGTDFISALATNGLYLNVASDAVGTVTVDYIAN